MTIAYMSQAEVDTLGNMEAMLVAVGETIVTMLHAQVYFPRFRDS